MYTLYTDDSILTGTEPKEIDHIVYQMCKVNIDITIDGTIEDFLNVNIDRRKDGKIYLTQPQLIHLLLEDFNLHRKGAKPRDMPACSSRILKRHQHSP